MDKIDFRSEANFLGKEVYIQPCNGENRKAVKQALEDMQGLQDLTNWYDKERQKIEDDGRLKDETKQEKLLELDKEFNDKADDYLDKVVDYRKKLCGIIFEFKDGFPDDEYFSNDKFDDNLLNRALSFFFSPPTNVKPKQSSDSSS